MDQGLAQKSVQGQMLLDQLKGLVPQRTLDRGNSNDYDLGMWAEHAGYNDVASLMDNPDKAHFSDIGKMPNHMTFSNESAYSTPAHQGGTWVQNKDKSWAFHASPYNMTQHTPEQMQEYFNKYEQGNKVVFPKGLATTVGK